MEKCRYSESSRIHPRNVYMKVRSKTVKEKASVTINGEINLNIFIKVGGIKISSMA